MSGAYYEHPDVVRSDAPDLQGFSIRTSREALPRAEALARSLLVECAKAGFHVESLAEGEARKESWTAARLILVMGVGYSFDLYELHRDRDRTATRTKGSPKPLEPTGRLRLSFNPAHLEFTDGRKQLEVRITEIVRALAAAAENRKAAAARFEDQRRQAEAQRCHDEAVRGLSVDEVVKRWPTLADPIKAAIVTLVRAL